MAVSTCAAVRPFLTTSLAPVLSHPKVWIRSSLQRPTMTGACSNPPTHLLLWIQVATRSLLTSYWYCNKLQRPTPPSDPSSPVTAWVEPALAWNQRMNPLGLPWKRMLGTQTQVKFHWKHGIVFSVLYSKSTGLGTDLFNGAQSYKFQKCWSSSVLWNLATGQPRSKNEIMPSATNSNHIVHQGKVRAYV